MTPHRESSAAYAAADGSALPMLMFEPGEGVPARAGVVLFHGGGLRMGAPDELAAHGRRLAAHGILAVSAGYRLIGRGAVGIEDCLADVRLAIEHFGGLAASRALGPARLASGGSSAGAHLALVAAMAGPHGLTPAPQPPPRPAPESPPRPALRPAPQRASEPPPPAVAAIVAFNPAGLDLRAFAPEVQRRLEDRVGISGGRLVDYSLIEHVRPGNPPVLIHHGTGDEVEPIDGVRRFQRAMARAGNECTLIEYEGAKHAFHYPGDSGHFDAVMAGTVRFLLERLAA